MLRVYVDSELLTLISHSGLTQAEASGVLGVPLATLRGWIRPSGPRSVDLDELIPPSWADPEARPLCCRATRVLGRQPDSQWSGEARTCSEFRTRCGALPHYLSPLRYRRDRPAMPGLLGPTGYLLLARILDNFHPAPWQVFDALTAAGLVDTLPQELPGQARLFGFPPHPEEYDSALVQDDTEVQIDVLDALSDDDSIPF
jgi:hypothetical protein